MIRLRVSFALLALPLAAGCGGSDGGAGDRAIATEALLTSQDFPAGVRERASVVSEAPCSPMPLLRGAQTMESSTFIVKRTSSTQQVIGVFPTADKASTAFDALVSTSRQGCIEGALRLYSSQRAEAGSTARGLPPRTLDIGDEARLMPFVVDQPGSPDLRVNAVLVRVDRAITDLLFLTQDAATPTPFITDAASKAVNRLTAALE